MEIRDRVVELRRVRANTLHPHPQNWRTHNDAQRAALRALVARVGFAGAMLAVERPEGLLLVDGHLRTEEAGDQEVPVLILDLDDSEVTSLLLAYDPLGAMAGANKERLDALLTQYDASKATLDPEVLAALQGSVDKMLAKVAKEAGSEWGKPQAVIEDEVPDAPAVPVTKPGDLWLLGAFYQCEACGQVYDYETGKSMTECPCG